MKLKSEAKMTDSKLYPHVYISGSLRDVEHDAAAAHALMQAMQEWTSRQALWIESRADELMRQWGFDDA